MNYLKYIIVTIIAVLSLVAVTQYSKIQHQQTEYTRLESVLKAAQDTVSYYQDAQGRTVAEKHALEASLKTIDKSYKLLMGNQQALLHDVKLLPIGERKNLIAGTSIVQEAQVINSININTTTVDKHVWRYQSDSLSYHIHAHQDTLSIDTLTIPNRVLLTQYRDSKGDVHVTARNTNRLVKNTDVDSIVIPAPEKKKGKGVFWTIVGFVAGVLVSR